MSVEHKKSSIKQESSESTAQSEGPQAAPSKAIAKLAAQLMEFFKGSDRSHGAYILENAKVRERDGKLEGRAMTVHKPVSVDLWLQHLEGKRGLGVAPILDDGKVYWGCFDIDSYTINPIELSNRLKGHPLLLCRSKSGGAHVFIFTTEPVEGKLMRRKLTEVAAAVGFGQCEIFPKQVALVGDTDRGSWLNMPYFLTNHTTRYCIYEGKEQNLKEFLELIKRHRLTPKELNDFQFVSMSGNANNMGDGPPCLQHLVNIGIQEGQRDVTLFNLAIYMRKKNPDTWEIELEQANRLFVNPPLPSADVQRIVKSVAKKEYHYQCSNPPLCNHCNRRLCMTRPHGIDGEEELPVMSGLTRIETEPPQYYLDVDEKRVGPIGVSALTNQGNFQQACVQYISLMPPRVSTKQWRTVINQLLEKQDIIEMPKEITPRGQLLFHILDYCERNKRDEREKLLNYAVWDDGDGFFYFRVQGLMRYLDRIRFKEFTSQQIAVILNDEKIKKMQFNLKGRNFHAWRIENPNFEPVEYATPKQEQPPF